MAAQPLPRGIFACVAVLGACSADAPREDHGAAGDAVGADDAESTDSSGAHEGPWMSVKVIQESGGIYYFTPMIFFGSWTESAWRLEAIDATVGPAGLRVLDFTIAGPMALTSSAMGSDEVSGTFGSYTDAVTYVGAVIFFETTSGTLTLTRLDVSAAAGAETKTVNGEFDVHWASQGLYGLEPHMIGTFGNIELIRSL
jgi:hypothetical protein